MSNPVGRPCLYEDRFCEMVIDCLSQGHSLVRFASDIGVCRETISDWRKKFPSFSVACKKAMSKSQQYWENELKKCARGEVLDTIPIGKDAVHLQKHNVTALIFLMKSRFDDYREGQVSDDGQMKYTALGSLKADNGAQEE